MEQRTKDDKKARADDFQKRRDEAFQRMVTRASGGDKKAVSILRKVLDKNPEIWRQAGDVTANAERAWIEVMAGNNWLAQESLRRRLADLKGELAGSHPTPLEQILVDQVAVNWLAAQHTASEAAGQSGSLGIAAMRLKRTESCQRRLLSAVRTLTTLRALAPQGLAPRDGVKLFDDKRKRA